MHCSLPSKVVGMIAVILVGNFALCLGTDTLEADFASIDADGDGFLTKEEILAMNAEEDPEGLKAGEIEDAVDRLRMFLDRDGDGKISLKEYISPSPDWEEMTEPEDLSSSSTVNAADLAVDAEGSVSAAAAATVGASSVSRRGRRKRRKFSKKSKKKAQKAILYALSSTCKPDSLEERTCNPSHQPCTCGHGWALVSVRSSNCSGQACQYVPYLYSCRRDCTDNPFLKTLCNTPLFGQQYCCKNRDVCDAKTWQEVKSYLTLHANAFGMLYNLGKTGAKTFRKALLKYTRKKAKKELKEAKKELINLVKNSVMEKMKSELKAEVGKFVADLKLPDSVPGLDESDMGSQLFQDAMAGLEMERMLENEDGSRGYFDTFVEEGREILEDAFMDFIDPIGFGETIKKFDAQLCSEGRAIWNDVDIEFEPGESILSRGTILPTPTDTWEWKTSSPAHVVKVLFNATNTQSSWEYARFAFSAMMFYNGNLVWSQLGLKPDHIAIPTAYPLLLEHGYFSPEVPQGVKVDHIKIISPNTNILSVDVLTWGIEEIDDGVENPHAPDKSVIVVCKGSTDVFDVNLSSTTVKDLKAKIAVWLESEGDNIQDFHLMHTYYEKGQTFTRELQNDMDTLSKYNIEYSDTIELQDKRTKCKVHVRLSQYYTSTVDVFLSSTTVGELKSKSMATGRRLMISRYYGYTRKIYLDDDNRTLHSYGVEPNEEIFAFDP